MVFAFLGIRMMLAVLIRLTQSPRRSTSRWMATTMSTLIMSQHDLKKALMKSSGSDTFPGEGRTPPPDLLLIKIGIKVRQIAVLVTKSLLVELDRVVIVIEV